MLVSNAAWHAGPALAGRVQRASEGRARRRVSAAGEPPAPDAQGHPQGASRARGRPADARHDQDERAGRRRSNYLLEHQADFPGVQIQPDAASQLRGREHFASQLLGYVGEITREQLEPRAKDGYAAGDRIGQTGLEATYDRYLRGLAGEGQVRVDALGRVTSDREFSQLPAAGLLGPPDDRRRPPAGGGGRARLRDPARARERRVGTRTAAPSSPWIRPTERSSPWPRARPTTRRSSSATCRRRSSTRSERRSANLPQLNRAVSGLYPPGSTFKPVTALAALQEKMLDPYEPIQCDPSITVDGQTFVNWDPFTNDADEPDAPRSQRPATRTSTDVGLRFYERKDSPLQKWAAQDGLRVADGDRRRAGGSRA